MYLLVLILVILDQVTKQFFGNIKNFGAAFGLLEGFNWLFVIIGFLVVGIIIYYKDKVNKYVYYGLIFLMAGVIGNLIDRLALGYVRDFIQISIYPSFNLADIFNVVGVLLILIYSKKAKTI